jgi:hypothetical protein
LKRHVISFGIREPLICSNLTLLFEINFVANEYQNYVIIRKFLYIL